MNHKRKIFFLLLFSVIFICGWGASGHKIINRRSTFSLPPTMSFLNWADSLAAHSSDADYRRNSDPNEAPRHYIDIDDYGDSAIYTMPRYWKQAVEKYSEDTLRAYGINPWHVAKTKEQLTFAFKNLNAKEILRISADMGHYIADGNVPLHTTHNYNGQYSGQYGIHGFWESRLPELYSDNYDFFVGKSTYVKNPQLRAWEATKAAHFALDSVFRFEKELTAKFSEDKKFGFEDRNGITTRVYSKEFSKAYHDMLNGQIEKRMKASIKMVGDFWYTCWIDAGQPNLDALLDFKFSKEEIEEEKRENEEWKKKKLDVRLESSIRDCNKNTHEKNSKIHNHLNCCGQHDFYTTKIEFLNHIVSE